MVLELIVMGSLRVFGDIAAHGVEGLIPYSLDAMELVFVQGLFEILEASNPVFST